MKKHKRHKKHRKCTKLRNAEYYDMLKKFDQLYYCSMQSKKFTKLTDIISSEENIRLAYRNIKRNEGSFTAGVDGQNTEDIEKFSASEVVKTIQERLSCYKPAPVKQVEIPKPNGKLRPLGIPTISDRLIQQCILQILEPICEAKFHMHSYGFRPNRSPQHAIAQCYNIIQEYNLQYVVDIDIKGFFDNVDHTRLIQKFWALGIRDKRLICIIKRMLKAPVRKSDETTVIPNKGTPQGGILSPLLANIYLNELDSTMEYYSYSENVDIHMIRYADDFKIFCRCREDAEKIFCEVKQWLKKNLKLEINEDKSKIVNLKKHYSDFLGFKMKALTNKDKLVVRSYMTDKALRLEADKLVKQLLLILNCETLQERDGHIKLYESMIRGIHNYYRFATEIKQSCIILQHQVEQTMARYLRTSNCIVMGNPDLQLIHKIGMVRYQKPKGLDTSICLYTPEGRKGIHECLHLCKSTMDILHMLAKADMPGKSIEYQDNMISLYAAQHGKCAVTKRPLGLEDIYGHHLVPINQDGNDRYSKLVIVHQDVHALIHAVERDDINKYLLKISPSDSQLKKINKFRMMLGLPLI